MLPEDYKVKAEFTVRVRALVELSSQSTDLPADTHNKHSFASSQARWTRPWVKSNAFLIDC